MTSAVLRENVRQRAGRRCEYCRLHEEQLPLWPFHLEHIVAEQHGGRAESENLAWSCQRCNLRKGTNLAAIDPDSGELVRLFHPREQNWEDHFRLSSGGEIEGLTAVGRATMRLLQMNSRDRVTLRKLLFSQGDS